MLSSEAIIVGLVLFGDRFSDRIEHDFRFEVFATRLYLLFVFSGVIPVHYTVCILQPSPPSAGG